jgi:hypothetical protein
MEKNVIIKKLILTFVISLLSLTSFAQDANDYFVRGAKVYIESNNENVI